MPIKYNKKTAINFLGAKEFIAREIKLCERDIALSRLSCLVVEDLCSVPEKTYLEALKPVPFYVNLNGAFSQQATNSSEELT